VITVSTVGQNLSFGADNFYCSNNVTLTAISSPTLYDSYIAGNIFVPHALSRIDAQGIIVDHPFGAMKEQSTNLNAQNLVEQGFVTVSIDLPFQGISASEPRNAVLSNLYIEAYSSAVDYLGTLELVDRENNGTIDFVAAAHSPSVQPKLISGSRLLQQLACSKHPYSGCT
jgi:fermentation-respiration switch protein FrsA (DUF1100 family)